MSKIIPDNLGKTPPEIPLGKSKGAPRPETIIEDRGTAMIHPCESSAVLKVQLALLSSAPG